MEESHHRQRPVGVERPGMNGNIHPALEQTKSSHWSHKSCHQISTWPAHSRQCSKRFVKAHSIFLKIRRGKDHYCLCFTDEETETPREDELARGHRAGESGLGGRQLNSWNRWRPDLSILVSGGHTSPGLPQAAWDPGQARGRPWISGLAVGRLE